MHVTHMFQRDVSMCFRPLTGCMKRRKNNGQIVYLYLMFYRCNAAENPRLGPDGINLALDVDINNNLELY